MRCWRLIQKLKSLSRDYNDNTQISIHTFMKNILIGKMRNVIVFGLFMIGLVACQSTSQDSKIVIKQLEDSLKQAAMADETLAQQLLGHYETYIAHEATTDEKPSFYIKSADLCKATGDYDKAVQLYEKIYTEFKNHEKAAQALFMQAFTYDTDLKNVEKAKSLYEQFITQYPAHELADDAKASLEVLGLSDEEALKKILENQKRNVK